MTVIDIETTRSELAVAAENGVVALREQLQGLMCCAWAFADGGHHVASLEMRAALERALSSLSTLQNELILFGRLERLSRDGRPVS